VGFTVAEDHGRRLSKHARFLAPKVGADKSRVETILAAEGFGFLLRSGDSEHTMQDVGRIMVLVEIDFSGA